MRRFCATAAAICLALAAYGAAAEGPGAENWVTERLQASEADEETDSYVGISRFEYASELPSTHQLPQGSVWGNLLGNAFLCELEPYADLLFSEIPEKANDAVVDHVVIIVDQEDVDYCSSGELPDRIAFDCVYDGYYRFEFLGKGEISYYDDMVSKFLARTFSNSLDCVAYIGEDIIFDANGSVWDGSVEIVKRIGPNRQQGAE